jgi:hypothetical protein
MKEEKSKSMMPGEAVSAESTEQVAA